MSARQRILALLAATLLACAATACTQNHAPQRQLTERERDSTLGKSVIPGAAVVTRALAVSDTAPAQAQRMDGATSGQ
jgi:hypothetical protein